MKPKDIDSIALAANTIRAGITGSNIQLITFLTLINLPC